MTHTEAVADAYPHGHGTDASPCWRRLAAEDSRPLPATLTGESVPDLGGGTIPPERYTSHDFHREEVEKVWKRSWQVVCREEEIPEVGDRYVYDIAGLSFLIVRSGPDRFKAYYNACLHRGRKLVEESGRGETLQRSSMRCPYHAWTWNLDGKLIFYPGSWDFPDVKPENFALREVQIDRWGGFLFINPDPSASPLADHLGSLPKHFESWPLDKRFTLWHVRKAIACNWKIALEAFLEAYHVIATHPQALPGISEHGTQYDLYSEGEARFSRLITPTGVPSQHSKGTTPAQSIAFTWALLNGLRAEDAAALPDDIRSRADLAQWRREGMKALTGADYASLSDAEMLDSVQYWVFPNFCPWYGEGLPLTYQFRPKGDSPDECWMDVWMLVRVPDDGPRPPAAELVTLTAEQPFAAAPQLGMMAEIFDQDDSNMPFVQLGLKTWPGSPAGLTLGRYQESRIRFLHQELMRAIERP